MGWHSSSIINYHLKCTVNSFQFILKQEIRNLIIIEIIFMGLIVIMLIRQDKESK